MIKQLDYTLDETIQDIYNCAIEVCGHGIAVPSDIHPCGWTWIDFENIDTEEDSILTYTFESYDLNDGLGDDNYEGLTLKQILEKTKGKFLFSINTYIDWDDRTI